MVLPTSTTRPTRVPVTLTPTATATAAEITPTLQVTTTAEASGTTVPSPTDTPAPPAATPPGRTVSHTIKRGETLSEIASRYGVTMQAIMDANDLTNASVIITGQTLIIPLPGEAAPTATKSAQPTNTPKPATSPQPTPTRKPPTATPKPPAPTATPATSGAQYTAQVVWDPMVAPNCAGPAIGKQSIVRDAAGNPVNDVRVEVDCYGNKWVSRASGTPGEYDAGHYDFAFGQSTPQDWTCTARVLDLNGQAVASSETVSIHFDTNDCSPGGAGHQVAILNWTKHW
jgi:LysM repeat protein